VIFCRHNAVTFLVADIEVTRQLVSLFVYTTRPTSVEWTTHQPHTCSTKLCLLAVQQRPWPWNVPRRATETTYDHVTTGHQWCSVNKQWERTQSTLLTCRTVRRSTVKCFLLGAVQTGQL